MEAQRKPVNLAMIGCEGYAGVLADLLDDVSDMCRLVAVATFYPDANSARRLQAKGVVVYASADEMITALSPDECAAIIVPTGIDSHYAYAAQAVQCGFHVLLEKPPVAVIQDLDRLIDLQNKSGKYIAVNFQYLFSPMTQMLKHRLQTGEFGEVRKICGRALWHRPESYFVRSGWSGKIRVENRWVLDGTIGNPLAHLLAEILYLASPGDGMAKPLCIQAELYRANAIDSEDTSCLRMETETGALIFCCASLCSKTENPVFCKIETENATICLVDYCQLEIQWADGRIETENVPGGDVHRDRRMMLRAVAENLSAEKRPLVTVEECRPYMQAWNGAFESFGLPAAVAEEFIDSEDGLEGGTVRCIRGLGELSQRAFREQKLFSELSVAWSKPGHRIELAGYSYFPTCHQELKSIGDAE